MQIQDNLKRGIFYFLLCRFFLASTVACVKLLEAEVSTPMVLLFQNGVGFLLCIPFMVHAGLERFKLDQPLLMTVRTVSNFLGFSCFFLTAFHMPLVNAVLLNTTTPLFLPFLTSLWFKKPINHKLWLPIGIGLVGIGFILHPTTKHFFDIWSLIGILGAVFFAFSTVLTRALAHTEHHHTIMFYFFLIATLLSLGLNLFTWESPPITALPLLLAIGAFFFLGQLFFVISLNHAKLTQLGPFNYTSIVFAAAFEWFIWAQIPTFLTIVGIILVTCGGVFTFLLTKNLQPRS